MSAPSFWHPAALTATVFGLGRVPLAPGTLGSAVALPIAWLAAVRFHATGLLAVSAVLFAIGWWASDIVTRRTRERDPQYIVIDEVAAQCLALVPASHDLVSYAIGFAAFRAADIWKPWPASWADRSLHRGIGVMADDFFAAIYAGIVVYLFEVWR